MINKVYLMWHSFLLDEVLEIGILERIENRYIFTIGKDIERAESSGCILPFQKSTKFESLPNFFTQRMVTKSMLDKMHLFYDPNDELSILTATNGVKNSDNFLIFTEEAYKEFCNEQKNHIKQ